MIAEVLEFWLHSIITSISIYEKFWWFGYLLFISQCPHTTGSTISERKNYYFQSINQLRDKQNQKIDYNVVGL